MRVTKVGWRSHHSARTLAPNMPYARDCSKQIRARSALAVFNVKERVFRGIAMLVFVLVFPFVFVFLAIYRGVSLLSFRREKKED